ncbi:MAG: hypothetical protein ACI90V_013495 [Bacillariaceae sp.]|jgi:hypothetical protein
MLFVMIVFVLEYIMPVYVVTDIRAVLPNQPR